MKHDTAEKTNMVHDEHHDDAIKGVDKAIQFLHTLRKSTEMAQELLNNNREMTLRVHSLEGELSNAKARIAFLERETTELRSGLAKLALDDDQVMKQFEQVVEEQNCLAHLFVSSDRLAQVKSPDDTLKAVVEILHNLVGARCYGVWFRVGERPVVVLAEPSSGKTLEILKESQSLVDACMSKGTTQQRAGASVDDVPIAIPLFLDGKVVGALVIKELVPQRPRLERLHRDLLGLLSERLANAFCQGEFYRKNTDPFTLWHTIVSTYAQQHTRNS